MNHGKTDKTAEMETFLCVACTGSLSAAARELALTPSAVSRIMTRLEKRLGVRLIVRSTRSLRLTSEGESYALAARRILKDLDDTEAAIANRGSATRVSPLKLMSQIKSAMSVLAMSTWQSALVTWQITACMPGAWATPVGLWWRRLNIWPTPEYRKYRLI